MAKSEVEQALEARRKLADAALAEQQRQERERQVIAERAAKRKAQEGS